MPKLKTHSGAKKRFKMTKKGKFKRAQAYRRYSEQEVHQAQETAQKSRLCTWHQRQGAQAAAALRLSGCPFL